MRSEITYRFISEINSFLLQKLENQVEQERIEVDHLQELLQSAKEKALVDKDALKKATRYDFLFFFFFFLFFLLKFRMMDLARHFFTTQIRGTYRLFSPSQDFVLFVLSLKIN